MPRVCFIESKSVAGAIDALGRHLCAALFALLVVLCAPSSSRADEANLVPPRGDCTAAESIPASLERFLSRPSRFMNKCIRVRGFVAFRSVAPSLEWLYQSPDTDKLIAIYGEDSSGANLWGLRAYADLVGFAYSCEQLGEFVYAEADRANAEAKKAGRDTESFPFISGNCHYHGGPLLWVSQATVDKAAPNRVFGKRNAKYGDLVPMASSARYASEITGAIAPMFDLIRQRDKSGLKTYLEKLGVGSASFDSDLAIDPEKTPFSFLLGASSTPVVHYFVSKDRARGAFGDYAAVGCICKSDGCDGKWPIAYMDVRYEPDWPYSCIQISKEGDLMNVDQ